MLLVTLVLEQTPKANVVCESWHSAVDQRVGSSIYLCRSEFRFSSNHLILLWAFFLNSKMEMTVVNEFHISATKNHYQLRCFK